MGYTIPSNITYKIEEQLKLNDLVKLLKYCLEDNELKKIITNYIIKRPSHLWKKDKQDLFGLEMNEDTFNKLKEHLKYT